MNLNKKVPVLYNHEPNQVIGEILELSYQSYRGGSLWCVARVYLSKQLETILAKPKVGFSIRCAPLSGTSTQNGQIKQVNKAQLQEISIGDRPVNPHAVITSKSQKQELFGPLQREVSAHFDIYIHAIKSAQRCFEAIR